MDMQNLTKRLEASKQMNNEMNNVVSDTLSNGKRVEDKDNKFATSQNEITNNLLKKINSMEKGMSRMERSSASMDQKLQDNDIGGYHGGGGDYNGSNDGGGGKCQSTYGGKRDDWRQKVGAIWRRISPLGCLTTQVEDGQLRG